jgi:penicillin-binding protein 2
VRNIYNALYGLDMEGNQDLKKALLPQPQKALPKIQPDGSIDAPKITPYVPVKPEPEEDTALAGPPPATGRRD